MAIDLFGELVQLYEQIVAAWNSLPTFPGSDFASSPENLKVTLIYTAPTFHVLGYLTYILFTLTGRIQPNTWSWLMFAYGTSLLTLLEWRLGAPFAVLFLPAVCAVMSIAVFAIRMMTSFAFRGGSWLDFLIGAFALSADVAITVYYLWVGDQLASGQLSSTQRDEYLFWFLIATNATALTAFSPLLWEMATGHGHESPLPWILWTIAYGCLGILTGLDGNTFTVLMLYPALNFALHLTVSILSTFSHGRGFSSE